MFRPLELYIGLRYTRAKRRNHFISFISLTSMIGIALGVTALITVLSVMNGFERELRERILSMVSHATVSAAGGMDDWQSIVKRVQAHKEVAAAAPYVEGEAMLTAGSQVSGTLIRGIDPVSEQRVSEVGEQMRAGYLEDLEPGEFGIILGRELALSLRVAPGDRVTMVAPQARVTPAGIMPRLRRFTVVGFFEVGMYEYDRGLAFVQLDDASRLFRLDGNVSGVRMRLDDMFQAPRVAGELARELGGHYRVSDWTRQHANFFQAVQMEKTVMFVILLLIVAVAVFNIVSTMVMVVTDKRADIAILRTLGASPHSVMGVFMVQGVVIGVVGTLIGMVAGVALALNVEAIVPALERLFSVEFLSPDVYYISDLPSDMRWADVGRVCGIAFGLSLLATVYPAWRAARTQPADALRYD